MLLILYFAQGLHYQLVVSLILKHLQYSLMLFKIQVSINSIVQEHIVLSRFLILNEINIRRFTLCVKKACEYSVSYQCMHNFSFPERVLDLLFVGQTWYKPRSDIQKLSLPEALTFSFHQGPMGPLCYRLRDKFLKFFQRCFENFHLLFNIVCNNRLN